MPKTQASNFGPSPTDRSVVEAVERWLECRGDCPAIEFADGILRYRDVIGASRTLADRISDAVTPVGFVGIEAQRAPAAIIGMLAAMRAQRAFVVIDPRDGDEMNRRKVSQLRVDRIVRPEADLADAVLAPVPPTWIDSDGATAPADLVAFQGRIAYAIYTSGSTGEPKCVLVGHDGLGAVIADHVQRLHVDGQSRTLQFAKLTFDGCLTEIFWTLCAGGCLVLVDEAALLPGTVLQETLERLRITHLKTTPFALTATMPSNKMRLRHVVNGGGACRRSCIEKWSAFATFHNAYGCTETTICNLLSDGLSRENCEQGVPLGVPVGNCTIRIVPDGPGADGTRGELVVTGRSVGIGYLHDDGVAPFLSADGAPLYRTGDLVEQRGSALVYVERLDRQIKLRGYRIDPGEVEDLICRFDGVDEAVVVAEGYRPGEADDAADALVCYFQGQAETRSLRAHLEQHLPYYKVPSVFRRLASMPYTKNGKLDRDALHKLQQAPALAAGAVSPGEEVLVLVRQLTGTEDAGAGDNFFDIGGDSASALLLLKKLKDLGWTNAGVRDIIRAETLGDLIQGLLTSEGVA